MSRVALTAVTLVFFCVACSTPASPPAPAASPATAPAGSAAAFPEGELVDLSHAYDEQTVYWPTADRFRLDKVADGVTPGGYYYAANNFFTSEHGGTHLDAPVHFAAGRWAVDQIPLDRLVGQAVVVDVTEAATANADYLVSVADFQRWEQQHGPIQAGAIVLLRTGFSRHWPDAARYLGTAERGEAAVAKLHFPGLHPDAARWIVANRPIKAIGLDTASIDYGQSTDYQSHRVLYERDLPAFENLTALERLPPRGAVVIALPMKITGGSGAPLRAIAILPAGQAQGQSADAELQKFHGTWVLISAEMDGKPVQDADVKNSKITFAGNKVEVRTPHQSKETIIASLTKIDATKNPKQMHWVRSAGPNAGAAVIAIYEFEGPDQYKIAFAPAGQAVPDKFRAEAGSGYIWHTWRRDTQ